MVEAQAASRAKRLAVRFAGLLSIFALISNPALAGVYVTEASGIRWNDVGGIRWNDVGGIRWNDVGGFLFSDASGIRWNDVGGIRWNDVGGIHLDDALTTGLRSVDLELLNVLSSLPDSSAVHVIVTYRAPPTPQDLSELVSLGIPGGTVFRRLPMVVVNATRDQIRAIAALPAVRSVYANRTLSFFLQQSRRLIGTDEIDADPDASAPDGSAPSGRGVTIAVIDTGVDATHPDLPFRSKVVDNVRLLGAIPTGAGFLPPQRVPGIPNTDLLLGHGTFVASVAAGSGAASEGAYRGTAPGASILGLSAGDLFIVHVLEGFDYVLENAALHGVRVVNCSWGTVGFFDPDDPVNVATRMLHDAGITVVFAAGNHGPSPDTLNPYAVAPWVIGVGATRKDGKVAAFSSRGIFEELLYRPTLVAPGQGIVAATPVALSGIGATVGVADPSGGWSVPAAHLPYYTVASGTSFAAPQVAGVVARMLEANPALTPTEIKRILQETATPILASDRAEIGAGRLDAWAAVVRALDASRPFGTHVPGWTDRRPYRIEHRPAVTAEAVLQAGGRLALPVSIGETALSWAIGLAWSGLPAPADLDLRVMDASGVDVGRSESFNGASLFGGAEGVRVIGSVPSSMTAEVFFKQGAGLADRPFRYRTETSVAVLTAYSDLDGLPAEDRDRVTEAVARHLMVGRGSRFEALAPMTRGELARSLALAAGRPQRIPTRPSFADCSAGSPDYPYVETVAGLKASSILMDPFRASTFQGPSSNAPWHGRLRKGPVPGEQNFRPGRAVSRLEFAVSLVRAAGLDDTARSRDVASLGLSDESQIPASLRGHVAVALEHGFIDRVASAQGWKLDPSGSVPRRDAARYLLRLLAAR